MIDEVTGPSRRSAAVSIASSWAAQDPAAARRWMLGLEAGPIRDAALSAYLLRTASALRAEDDRLYDAFSSAAARDQAVEAARRQSGIDPNTVPLR
jgi:hypothetical protein